MIKTVSLSGDFIDSLIDELFLLAKFPLEMAQCEIILPTKRACRLVKEAFLKKSTTTSFLLPKLTSLYDLDFFDPDIPPAVDKIERLALLSRLVLKKPNITSLDQAVKVASSLASLLDELYQFECNLSDLNTLVENKDMAGHWEDTVQFLDIINHVWPALLHQKNKIDVMQRTVLQIKSYDAKLQKNKPNHPIILAGFDGNIPCVLNLIKTLSVCDNCLILLNGFNNELTTEDLKYITSTHYQYPFKKILDKLSITASSIQNVADISPQEELIIESLKSPEQSQDWRCLNLTDDVLAPIQLIDCDTIGQEAMAIALLLRKIVEMPKKTACVVTNNRLLARRIIVQMNRWGVTLDDSAGTPLHHTPVGVYLTLLAKMGINTDINTRLSLLKHPLSADGQAPGQFKIDVKNAELSARKDKKPFNLELKTNLTEFLDLFNQDAVLLTDLLSAHIKVAQELATTDTQVGADRLFSSPDGVQAQQFLTNLLAYSDTFGKINPQSYVDFIVFLLSSVSVRSLYGTHPQIEILGPIEARLSHKDVCIIAGLNEGAFPTLADIGPWLNRPMRLKMGLPALERKIAEQALDFAHLFCAKEVYLTRSVKEDGSQSIPSRFISRIDAVLKASNIKWVANKPVLADLIDVPTQFVSISRPAPCPDVNLRPKKLSVTNIELLMRNPYAIYAKYILKLKPLEALEDSSNAKLYGSAIHSALEEFMIHHPFNDNQQMLVDILNKHLLEKGLPKSFMCLYQTKLQKIASYIINMQQERKHETHQILIEKTGVMTFELDNGDIFTLTGKADRIDELLDGSVEIFDYKTGNAPGIGEIKAGLAPQLPLEALILAKNGFEGIENPQKIKLTYICINGKKTGGSVYPVLGKDKQIDEFNLLLEETQSGLYYILNQFNQKQMAYIPSPIMKNVKYNDYEHLSREKEWATTEDDND